MELDCKKEKEKLYKLADEADVPNPLSIDRQISYLKEEMEAMKNA